MTATATARTPLLFLALAVGAGIGSARAQDLPAPGEGFTWERVGDVGIEVRDLAYGPDETLWAMGSDGPHRLDLSGGFPGAWVFVSDFSGLRILPLGRGPDGDTLLVTTGSRTYRTTDGGGTWTQVHDRGYEALYEVPRGYPFAGRIFTSSASISTDAIGYSDDRGATFTDAFVPTYQGSPAEAEDFVALPPSSSNPGRILAAVNWGVVYSDDGGATFEPSGLWGGAVGHAIDALTPPGAVERAGAMRPGTTQGGGAGDAVLAGRTGGKQRVWSSADGGETWEGGVRLMEGPPNSGRPRAVLTLGEESALVLLRGGTIYRTDDAGQTWQAVGRVPEISLYVTAASAALGPDGRLYVGLVDVSVARGWAWRTAEAVTAAVGVSARPVLRPTDAALSIPPTGGSFAFTATLRNFTAEPQTLRGWTAVEGPASREPVLGPLAVTLAPGASLTRTLTQAVPAQAPAGAYTYTVRTGALGGEVIAESSFAFEKEAGAAPQGDSDEGWRVSGAEGWGEAAEVDVAVGSGVALSVSPNPSRGAATVAVTVSEAGEARVSVYDVLGRRVAVLHEGSLGAGHHTLTLDGHALPPGVYVVRVAAGGVVQSQRVTILR